MLVKNVSPHGAVAAAVRAMAEEDRRDRGEPDEEADERDRRAAQSLFSSLTSI